MATRAKYGIPLLLVALAVPATRVDIPLSAWFLDEQCPKPIAKLFELSEAFSHGIGVAVILVILFVLDPLRRRCLPRVAISAFGAGLAANLVKLMISRARPHHFNFPGNVSDTFLGWFPLFHSHAGQQSFPSAHTATAAGLAVALTHLYPRGRLLFPALAALAGCQRLVTGAHWLSDVLCGAALGAAVGMLAHLNWVRCKPGNPRRTAGILDRETTGRPEPIAE